MKSVRLFSVFSASTWRRWPLWCGLGGVTLLLLLSSHPLSFMGQQEAAEAKLMADAFQSNIEAAHQAWLKTSSLQGILNLPNFLDGKVDFSVTGYPIGTTATGLSIAGNTAACHEILTEMESNKTPVFTHNDILTDKVSLPSSAYWCTQAVGAHSCLYTYKDCGDTVDNNYFIYNSGSGAVDFHPAHSVKSLNSAN